MLETETIEVEVMEPLPLPADLEAYEQDADAREDDGAPLIPLTLPTLADAQRALARVRYFRKMAAEIAGLFDNEERELLAELTTLRARKAEAARPWERREQWYMNALEQFVRAQNQADPKVKTLKLPAGDLALRAQQPEWTYGDEQALAKWLQANAPEYVRPSAAKVELKKAVEVREDGTVALAASGEIIPGITVMERPAKFDLKIAL